MFCLESILKCTLGYERRWEGTDGKGFFRTDALSFPQLCGLPNLLFIWDTWSSGGKGASGRAFVYASLLCVTLEPSSIYLPKPKTTSRFLAPFLWASASCITECTLGGQRSRVGPYTLNNRPATSETQATGPLSYWNPALLFWPDPAGRLSTSSA